MDWFKRFNLALVLASLLFLGGCSDFLCWPFDCSSSETSSGTGDDGGGSGFDLSKVTWLHTNVSSWPVTSDLKVTVGAGTVCLAFTGTNTWPTIEVDHRSGKYKVTVNANPWVFVKRAGKWYGGTWEWLVPGTTCKSKKAVAGDHIKIAPLKTWGPKTGDELYFMVSALARTGKKNDFEARTNVVKFIWP